MYCDFFEFNGINLKDLGYHIVNFDSFSNDGVGVADIEKGIILTDDIRHAVRRRFDVVGGIAEEIKIYVFITPANCHCLQVGQQPAFGADVGNAGKLRSLFSRQPPACPALRHSVAGQQVKTLGKGLAVLLADHKHGIFLPDTCKIHKITLGEKVVIFIVGLADLPPGKQHGYRAGLH